MPNVLSMVSGRSWKAIISTITTGFVSMLALACFTAAPSTAEPPPTVDWLARYSAPGGGNSQVTAMSTDSRGNILVTGYSSGTWWDVATVKYSPSGRQLHVARYNGPMGGDDVPQAMAVDASGNVYVAGYTDGNGQYNYDFLTVKYDSTLTQQWVRTYAGEFNIGLDEAFAVAAGPAGSVYVTGDSFEASTDHDYATIKYDAGGNQLWVRRYNGPGNQGDGGNSIAVDEIGNAYVTGISNQSSSGLNMDVATVKYGPTGVLDWVRRYDGPASSRDIGIRLILDPSRNVYVTGASGGVGTRDDMVTIKYAQDGTERWVRRYNGPGNSFDASLAIALVPGDGVCVTGYDVRPEGDADYATIRYNDAGDKMWVATYNGPVDGYDEGQAVAADADGNIYVTGYSDGGSVMVNYDYATVKYDSTGLEQWVVRYNGPGDNIDVAAGILVDADRNVIVSGWSTGTHLTDVDFATIRYHQTDVASAFDPNGSAGSELHLSAAPNPFRESTAITFYLPQPADVDLRLFDVEGRAVRDVAHDRLPSGFHSVALSGRGLRAGRYFYRLRAGAGSRNGTLTVIE
jgi:uncharacterized delta-60 repeat protein